MSAWNSQRFLKAGRRSGVDDAILKSAIEIAQQTLRVGSPGPPILTLGHLGHYTGIGVKYLRGLVARDGEDSYREFTIRKRPIQGQAPRFRFIAVPEPKLMVLQRWIASEILQHAPLHSASVAYAPGSRLVDAANKHTKAKWLIKIDVRDFFESITEIDAYRVFLERGYQPLTALELARICTRLREDHRVKGAKLSKKRRALRRGPDGVSAYYQPLMGALPQGAPTSPMLANLVARPLDEDLQTLAIKFKVRYTRYADDLIFSTSEKSFGRAKSIQLIGKVYAALGQRGLTPNTAKTLISPPGARKVALGLLVDGKRPQLSRDFRANLRMHMHFLRHDKVGPRSHARNREFSSVEGLRQHLLGLIAFAGQIDPVYAEEYRTQFGLINWSL